MSNKLPATIAKTGKWFLVFIAFSIVLANCKKSDNSTTTQPVINYELGLVQTPSSVYAAIPNAPAPAPSGTLPSSFMLEIPSQAFDQGIQGSCVSCASAMCKSILDHAKNNVAYKNNGIIYSPAYLFNQVHIDPNNCAVGSYVYANLDLLKKQGVCKISEMPYKESDCQTKPNSSQTSAAAANKIDHYFKIDPITTSWIKEFIYVGHAVVIAFQVDDFFTNAMDNGVWKQFGSTSIGLHAALLVGWDDAKNAFKLLNSWGKGWKDNGTGWVDYNFVQNGASSRYGKIFTEAYIIQNPAVVVNNPPVADFDATSTSIIAGQEVTFRDKSTNTPVTWSWSFSGGSPKNSSSQNPTVLYASEGTYSVTLNVSNSYGSDSKTRTNYITVTSKPVTTWTCGQDFIDPRDGNRYKTVNINGQCWLAENLKYTGNGTIGSNYGNSDSYYRNYGRLYSFDEVRYSNIAPLGWHVPTSSEVKALNDYIFKNYSNYGGALKSTSDLWQSPNTGADNATGFSAIPGGMVYRGDASDRGREFYMWHSTADKDGDGEASTLGYDRKGFGGGVFNKNHYLSVRCIKD